MWRTATYIFATLVVLSPIVTEILRSIVHRKRERREGIGGAQDIAMWGTFVGLGCIVGAGVSALGWYLTT